MQVGRRAAARLGRVHARTRSDAVKVVRSRLPADGKSLGDFVRAAPSAQALAAAAEESAMSLPASLDDSRRLRSLQELEELEEGEHEGEAAPRSFFIETFGCQMNAADSEIVRAILLEHAFAPAARAEEADVVLLNTCAVRENAEAKVWNRLEHLRRARAKRLRTRPRAPATTVGVLGCMAERLKTRLLEADKMVDLVVGPDAYRDLPNLLAVVRARGEAAVNVQLSLDETYADIAPVRADPSAPSAFVSIMRGCNNMCSYCIVPFTRGRERSRDLPSIEAEVRALAAQGVKEVVLLGQNVNSFHDRRSAGAAESGRGYVAADGFGNLFRARGAPGFRFVDLLDRVSRVDPELRVRFTSPHPKDFPDDVLALIAERPNVCKQLHMPAQSGASSTLARMRRGYSREAYLALADRIRARIPGVALSTDLIAGFCGETEREHADTLSLMRRVAYDQAFMFAYSQRARTHAAHRMPDDVPPAVKLRRLQEVIDTFGAVAARKNAVEDAGRLHLVLVQGPSRRSSPAAPALTGLTDTNKRCVFPDSPMPASIAALLDQRAPPPADSSTDSADDAFAPLAGGGHTPVRAAKGDYVLVRVHDAGRHTLRATPVARTTLVEAAARVPAALLGARPHRLDALGLDALGLDALGLGAEL